MNDEALKDAHKLFSDTGYNESIDNFKTLISTNKDALNDAFTLFTETGYNGSIDDFSTLIGISESAKGKTETTEELVAETVPLDEKEKEESKQLFRKMTPEEYVAAKNPNISLDNVMTPSEFEEFKKDPQQAKTLQEKIKRTAKKLGAEEKRVEQPNVIVDKLARLHRGIASTVKGGSEFVDMIELGAKSAYMETFTDMSPDEKNKALDQIKRKHEVLESGHDASVAALNDKIREYDTENITDDISNGNYLQATDRIIGGMFESAPSLVLAYLGPGGIASIGATSAGNTFDELLKENPDEALGTLMLNATATGITEAAFETVTRGILGRAKNLMGTGDKAAAKALLDSYGTQLFKRLSIDPLKEGLSEAATEFSADLIDFATLSKYDETELSDFLSNNWKNYVDAGLIGTGTGMSIATTGALTNTKESVRNAAEAKLTPPSDKKIINDAALNINELNSQLKDVENKDEINIINNNIKKQQQVILDTKAKVREELNLMNKDELLAYAVNVDKVNKWKNNLNSKSPFVVKKSQQEIDLADAENLNFIRESVNRRLDENVKTVQKEAGKIGRTVNSFNTSQEYQNAYDNTETGKKNSMNITSSDGFFDPAGDIYINKEVAEKVKSVNVASHELLHGILNNSFKEPAQLKRVVEEFKGTLPPEIAKQIESRIDKNYRYENFASPEAITTAKEDIKNIKKNEDGSVTVELKEDVYNEEYLTSFADLIGNREIKFNENIFQKVGNYLTPFFKAKGYSRIKFDTGKDVYNFIKDYQKQIAKGELKQEVVDLAKEGVTGELITPTKKKAKQEKAKLSKTKQVPTVPNVKPKQVETMINKVANRAVSKFWSGIPRNVREKAGLDRRTYLESAKTELAGIAEKFDPTRKDKDGNPISFDRYMANTGMQRLNALATKLGVESAEKPTSKRLGQPVQEGQKEFDIKSPDPTPEEAMMAKEKIKEGPDRKGIKLAERLGDAAKKISEKVKKMKPVLEGKTYKTLKDLVPADTQRMFGIKPKPGNLTKQDVKNAQQFINKNADVLLAMLPEGTTVGGKATGVQKVLLDAFYNKGRRVKAAKTGSTQGLATQNKKPNIKISDFKEVFGITPAGQPNIIDRNTSARIKALVDQTGKLITNQAIREVNLDAPASIAEGKSRVMFSKQIESQPSKKTVLDKKSDILKEEGQALIPLSKEGVKASQEFMLGDLIDIMGDAGLLLMIPSVYSNAGNRVRGFNKKTGKPKPNSGAWGRGFKFISDLNATEKSYGKNSKEYKEALKAIETGEIGDLTTIRNQARDIINQLEKQPLTSKQIGLIKQALGAQVRRRIKLNLETLNDINKGKELILDKLRELVQKDKKNLSHVADITYHANSNAGPFRNLATVIGEMIGIKEGQKVWEEHMLPFGEFSNTLLAAISKSDKIYNGFKNWVKDNYWQEVVDINTRDILDQPTRNLAKDGKSILPKWASKDQMHPLLAEHIQEALDGKRDWKDVVSPDIRKYNEYHSAKGYINPNKVSRLGKTDAQRYNVEVPTNLINKTDVIALQNDLIYQQLSGKIDAKTAKARLKAGLPIAIEQSKSATPANNKIINASGVMKSENVSNAETIREANIMDKALNIARDPNAPVKKIRVFDFDDTLARTKSKVRYTMPDGKEGVMSAADFAKRGTELMEQGAEFDFSDFNKVVDGRKGPLFKVAEMIAEKRGTQDMFVLTARASDAAPAIKEFLDALGLNIPIENITGLGDSSPLAKSGWMVEKAAEGYNDFYFADDATKNVKAVQKVMDVIDVKSKVQQAKVKFSKNIDQTFNDIIEEKTGIGSEKEYSPAKAQTVGSSKGKFKFWIAPSAEDFVGLLYTMLGKGKLGDTQMAWFKKHLLDPYGRAMENISREQTRLSNDFKALKKALVKSGTLPKNLNKKAVGNWTYQDVSRIVAWNKQGLEVPGLSKADLKDILDFANENPGINEFADQLIAINKGDGYIQPGKDWYAGTITTDLLQGLREGKRAKYLQEWQANADLIFSEKNLNKLEAAFGSKYREAMEDMLRRMKTGKNRTSTGNRLENRLLDYVNNSVGTVMFLNMRSGVLQLISAANFLNWKSNNILAAGRAFANQKQYWSDFMRLMNSDFLVDRRNGLKINVSESEIADAARDSSNKARSVISYLLKKGFTVTQVMDSFAIASGGATFYRNRIKELMKQNPDMTKAEAEAQAYQEFRELAEESQQSSRPDRISQQQASNLGRIILAFANTPMQYNRIMKKAFLDLKNQRGDWKSNISKIVYYGAIQNAIFVGMQQALFALAFDDEEETDEVKKKKYYSMANNMMDNILRGLGMFGAGASALINVVRKVREQSEKEGSWPPPDYDEAAWEFLNFSPPIDIKMSKLRQAANNWKYEGWKHDEAKWGIEDPAYESAASVISALTNIPVDRFYRKMENIQSALDSDQETWKRIANLFGWSSWQLESTKEREQRKKEEKGRKKDIKKEKVEQAQVEKVKQMTPQEKKKHEEEKKRKKYKDLNKDEQVHKLDSLGLSKKEIRALKYEKDRVEKLLELMENED